MSRTVQQPSGQGVGDGRAVYLLWAADAPEERSALERDASTLREHGFTVIQHTAPSGRLLREVLYGQDPELEGMRTAALFWSGPAAHDGSLRLDDGWIAPSSVEPGYVSHELDWVVFAGASSGAHRARWQERLGAQVKVVATASFEPHVPTELIAELLLPGGAGAAALAAPPEDWTADGPGAGEGGELSADEATYWRELFGLLDGQRADAIELQLGLSTRQYVWRLGELLATAAVHRLQDRGDDAQAAFAEAEAAAEVLTPALPPLFQEAGDVRRALNYLQVDAPRSAVGRGVTRFGEDHTALFEFALRLLLLALPDEVSGAIRSELADLAPRTGLDPQLCEELLAYSSRELFAKGHARVFDALAGERKPRHVTRAMAFGYGRRLSMAGTMNLEDDAAAEEMLTSCKDMADLLGVTMPPKLERLGRYRGIADELRERHGPDHAGLFDLAIHLVTLRASYDPMSPETVFRLMRRINKARKRAGLPKKLFRLLDRMKESTASRSEGTETIHHMLQILSEHLLLEADAA